MAKFSEVAEGVRARRPAKLPLPGATVDGETGEWLGPTVDLDLRALNEDEYELVLERALAFARKKGLESPEDGDALYERGKILHTLARACIDQASPKERPEPFFDGLLADGTRADAVTQIQKSEVMTPEVVGYLYERQQLVQDEVAPMKRDMTTSEFMAAAFQTAKGNMAFFVNSRPGTRWSFARTLASQFIASLANSSLSSPSSEPRTSTTSSGPP